MCFSYRIPSVPKRSLEQTAAAGDFCLYRPPTAACFMLAWQGCKMAALHWETPADEICGLNVGCTEGCCWKTGLFTTCMEGEPDWGKVDCMGCSFAHWSLLLYVMPLAAWLGVLTVLRCAHGNYYCVLSMDDALQEQVLPLKVEMFQETTTRVELFHLSILWPPHPPSPFLLLTLSKTESFVKLLWLEMKNLVDQFFFLIILFKLIWDTKQAQGHQGSSLKHMKRHQLCAKKAKQLMSPSWYEHNSDTTFFHTVCQYGDDDSRSSLTGRRRPPLKWSSPRQIFTWNWLLFL